MQKSLLRMHSHGPYQALEGFPEAGHLSPTQAVGDHVEQEAL